MYQPIICDLRRAALTADKKIEKYSWITIWATYFQTV